ncbi:MAG: tetratricopeptide repeat protein [Xenococcaceae cyanobacterium]
MTVLTIREQQQTDTEFTATLNFDSGSSYDITVKDPFTPKQEQELEWYFEEWLVFPMLSTVKANRAANSVQTYGENLFEQVFKSDFDAYGEYRDLRGKLSQLQIVIESQSPEFQGLHWEALKDPDLPRPLSVECIMLRKRRGSTSTPANIPTSPTLNLLVVTARPDEEKDVGYRTISRPLVELVDNSQIPVKVDILRPGTYEALAKHLDEKGEGYYHLIHFDVHGALMEYEQYKIGVQSDRYRFQRAFGLRDLEPYEGVKAFLFLEGEEKKKATPVEATELANLLTGKNIPVCILNACQSGKQVSQESEDYRETSLGSRLMAAGMQAVVAMGYSVTVSAAKVMMEQIYQQLFDSKELTEAIRRGRWELFHDKERRAYFNKTIELEDWLLPVVYRNRPVDFNLRQFTDREEEDYYEFIGSQYEFPQPEYGFVGRDLDILKIEKALLKHNVLLLQGMGGTGKTTLLNYLREWWQRTNFTKNVFYFGYDQKAWTLEQIVHEMGKGVYNRFEQRRFQAMKLRARVKKLEKTLRSEAYILVLDNLESVTGQPLAIQNTLPEQEREEIAEFLKNLVGGKSKVVLGSRSEEAWLRERTFRNNTYQLQGLDREARSVLAERILERHAPKRKEEIKADENFDRLMKLLAGYPLAMEVVLANLKRQSPQEILSGLQLASLEDVGGEDKTNSIVKCVEYSHSNLSPEAQQLLLCLAPFSGFIDRSDIPNYSKQLQQLEPFQSYQFDQFEAAIEEAIHWGLLSPMSEQMPRLLAIQPVFPYFLKTKLRELDDATQKALQEGFKNHYRGLASYYNQLLNSKNAQERQLGIVFCRLEYENLYSALQITLNRQESILMLIGCLHEYLDVTQDTQTSLELLEYILEAFESYPPEAKKGQVALEILATVIEAGTKYFKNKNYQKAKETYQKSLKSLEQISDEYRQVKQTIQASILHGLGIVAQETREWEQARRYFQQALELKIEFGDRFSQASTLHQLGRVAQETREWEQARRYYQQALDLKIEFGDRYEQAPILHQLGRVAQETREWEQARRYYQQALDIYIEFGDRFEQADTLHNLGIVAQETREWEQARRYYQQALDLKIEFGDRYSQARTLHNLGIVAQETREWEQARRYYQQALNLFIEFGDRFEQASTYFQLGTVAEALEELEEAKNYYLQDLQITVEFNDEHNLGISLRNLVRFYQETQDEEILTAVVQVLGMTVEELKAQINSEES